MRVDVKVAIVKSGMKQYEIAQELGIPESTLSKFVRGYGVLAPEKENQLATILRLNGGPLGEPETAGGVH